MSEPNIVQSVEGELNTIATAKQKLREYRKQVAELLAKLDAELGERASIKFIQSTSEEPTKAEVLAVLKPKEGVSMIELGKRLGKRFSSAQLRKLLVELEVEGKLSRKGQKRSTTYTLKA